MDTAIFAAGCFWGVESKFRKIPGVVDAEVGYTGGELENPSYEIVCSGTTGHAEAVRVTFDPKQVTFEQLVDQFWQMHDPTTLNRQGPDIGTQYRSAIFFLDEEQEQIAHRSKDKAGNQFDGQIVTQIVPASEFWRAEEYHQRYLEKNPGRFCY